MLQNTSFALFFTGGVGLKTWAQVGNLEREIAIYQRLAEHLKAVNFVTYGGRINYKYTNSLGNIGLYPISWRGLMPIIGIDVEGIQDEIKHGETGYLCGTDSESIADAIQELLADKSLQHKMGENARRYVRENYSIERVLKIELDVIREVIT